MDRRKDTALDRLLRLPDSKVGAKIVHPGQPVAELLRVYELLDHGCSVHIARTGTNRSRPD